MWKLPLRLPDSVDCEREREPLLWEKSRLSTSSKVDLELLRDELWRLSSLPHTGGGKSRCCCSMRRWLLGKQRDW